MVHYVSIVIPTLNSEETLEKCLLSIEQLEYPCENIEVIIVDNGSIDRTREIAETFGHTVYLKPDLNVGALRNFGSIKSRGDVLAHTDSDCLFPKQWLEIAVENLENENTGAVGGGCSVPDDASWVEKSWVVSQKSIIMYAEYLPACNIIIKKEIYNKVGGFNEKLVAGEDDDLSLKIRKHGYKLISHKFCRVIHLGYPKTLFAVAKRQMWHGKSTIYAKKNIFDKMFLFSHIFVINLLLFPIALLYSYYDLTFLLVNVNCLLLIPITTASYKSMKNNLNFDGFLAFLKLSIIYFYFFWGRSIGVLLTYKELILKWLNQRG